MSIQPPPPQAPFSSLPPPETGHRLNPSGSQGRRRQGVILHHQIRSRSPPVRRRGRALHGGRDREKKGDANWKTVAKSRSDSRRCSAHSLLPDLLEVIRVLVAIFLLAFCRIDGSTSTSGYGCRRSSSHTLSVQGPGMT
jgi:hypothetical protein